MNQDNHPLSSKETERLTEELTEEQRAEQERRRLEALYGPKPSSPASQEGDEPEKRSELSENDTDAPATADYREGEAGESERTDSMVEASETKESGELGTSDTLEKGESAMSDPLEEKGTETITLGEEVCRNLLIFVSPLLIPLYLTILIFKLSILEMVPTATKTVFTLIILGLCSLLPLLLIIGLKKAGLIKDIWLSRRKDRTIPYMIMILALGGAALFFAIKGAPAWMWLIYAGSGAAAIANMAINFRWKICNHATGTAILACAILVMQNFTYPQMNLIWWETGAVILAGITGTLCMAGRTHTLLQTVAGYCTGILGVLLFQLI